MSGVLSGIILGSYLLSLRKQKMTYVLLHFLIGSPNTLISKNANLARHNKTNELKQNILTMWHKNCADFETIKAAGDHYEEAMIAQGHKITSETIRGYISEYAKTVGFTFPRHQK